MVAAKDCQALITYFLKVYKTKYNVAPVVNRNKAKWAFEAILTDYSIDETKDLVNYYFTTTSGNKHSLEWFLYNYDKLISSLKDKLEDDERRKKLRDESEKRAKEWRERGNRGISSN